MDGGGQAPGWPMLPTLVKRAVRTSEAQILAGSVPTDTRTDAPTPVS